MQEGSAALARRDYPAAEAAAREVLARRGPRAADAQLLLAQAEMGERNYQQAAPDFYDAYNRSRTGARAPDALLGVANALLALGDRPPPATRWRSCGPSSRSRGATSATARPRPGAAPAAADPVTAAEFAAAMARLGPWDAARRVAVAVSGGADSLALAVLAQRWGDPVALIVDHGLRPGSAAEAEAARAALAARGMPARILRSTGCDPAPACRRGPGPRVTPR